MSNYVVWKVGDKSQSFNDLVQRIVDARGPRRRVRLDIPLHEAMRSVVEDARARIFAWSERQNLPFMVPTNDHMWGRARKRHPWEPVPVKQESFMDALPRAVVLGTLWPLIVDGQSAVENFQICCCLRVVCKGWKEFVEGTKEWEKGLEAWTAGEGRVVFGGDEDPYASPRSECNEETDEEWVLRNSRGSDSELE